MDVCSQQGLLKLETRAFLASNQVERKSLISKSTIKEAKNLTCEQAFGRAENFPCYSFSPNREPVHRLLRIWNVYTEELRHNEPLYNEVLSITNDFFY